MLIADQDDGGLDGDAEQGKKAEGAGDAERRVGEFQSDQRADGFREDDAECNGDREFEVAVEREKNQKNQQDSKRADDVQLRLGVEEFAVFAAPIEPIGLPANSPFSQYFSVRPGRCLRDCDLQWKTECRCSANYSRDR